MPPPVPAAWPSDIDKGSAVAAATFDANNALSEMSAPTSSQWLHVAEEGSAEKESIFNKIAKKRLKDQEVTENDVPDASEEQRLPHRCGLCKSPVQQVVSMTKFQLELLEPHIVVTEDQRVCTGCTEKMDMVIHNISATTPRKETLRLLLEYQLISEEAYMSAFENGTSPSIVWSVLPWQTLFEPCVSKVPPLRYVTM